MQDELAALFDRHMSMTQLPPVSHAVELPKAPEISNNIHQHVPTSHMDQNLSPHSIIDILSYRGLDPNTLTPTQLRLFENAGSEQRERLIQTWQLYSQIGEASNPTQDLGMNDSTMNDSDEYATAESYMITGYQNKDSLPSEPTTGEPYVGSKDPVYQGQEWWEMTRAGPVEVNYGALETRRYYPSCGVYRC